MYNSILSNISNITNATVNLNNGDNNSRNDQIAVIVCVGVFFMIIGLWMDGVFDCNNRCRFFGGKKPTTQTPLLAVSTNNAEAHEETTVDDPASVIVETVVSAL